MLVYMPNMNGSDLVKTYYSIISENNSSNVQIIKGMKRRILDSQLFGYYRTAIFYDNQTKTEIEKINGVNQVVNFSYDKEKSKVKMLVFVPAGDKDNCIVRYSPLEMNTRSLNEIASYMELILTQTYSKEFRTAAFYENLQNNQGRLINKVYGRFYINQTSLV